VVLILKKIISILVCTVLIFTIVGCNNKNKNKLIYSGNGNEWQATIEFNTGGTSKTVMKYLGTDKKPMKIKFKPEWLSGNTSEGIGEYTENAHKNGGLTVKFDNDDIINGNIEKYKNKDILKIEIEWNDKKEKIDLKKQSTS
jgi:uncharacterized lipoprotein YehR (DUF1307 family)